MSHIYFNTYDIAPEIWVHTFSFIEDRQTLSRIEGVCKNWKNQRALSWKTIFLRDYPLAETPNGSSDLINWKHLYKRQYLIDSNIQNIKVKTESYECDYPLMRQSIYEDKLFLTLQNFMRQSICEDKLFLALQNSSVEVLNFKTGDVLCSLNRHHNTRLLSVGEDKLATCAVMDGNIRISSIYSDETMVVINNPDPPEALCICLNKLFFTHQENIKALPLSASSSDAPSLLKGHTAMILSLSSLQGTLYSSSVDKTIRSWNARTEAPLHIYAGHTGAVIEIALTADWLFSISLDKTLRVWNPETGLFKEKYEFNGVMSQLHANEGRVFFALNHSNVGILNVGKNFYKALTTGSNDKIEGICASKGRVYVSYGNKFHVWDFVGEELEERMPVPILAEDDDSFLLAKENSSS